MRLTGPMIIGIIASISVSLVDAYFVGKLGTSYLAALSFSFPVTMVVVSLSIGLGAGVASVVSRSMGANDKRAAKRLTTDSLALALVLVISITLVGLFTVEPLFIALGATGDTLGLIMRYMKIWYFSMPFLIIPMVANAVIRAAGDAFWPSLIMVASSLVNIVFTPLLIFGYGPIPAFDIEGAALGTLVAHVFTLVLAMWIVTRREHLLDLTWPGLPILVASWKKVITVAIPAALGNAINPIGIAIVTAIIATYGESLVAAFGIATRVESFAVIPMLALSAVIGPVSGQNWGAGKIERVIRALKFCYAACFAWAAFIALLLGVFGPEIANLFSDDADVQQQASTYLYIIPISVWGYGWVIVASGAYNAIGKPVIGLGFYLVRTAALYVPLSFIASLFAGSFEVFLAIAATNLIAGLVVGSYSLAWLNKRVNTNSEQLAISA